MTTETTMTEPAEKTEEKRPWGLYFTIACLGIKALALLITYIDVHYLTPRTP
jgi:hypothetical protein